MKAYFQKVYHRELVMPTNERSVSKKEHNLYNITDIVTKENYIKNVLRTNLVKRTFLIYGL